jgi:preprotein translocase subunit Sec63
MFNDYIDYYAVLNLPQQATIEEIRRAYRKKVMDCHPDLFPDDADKLRLFETVKEAYETLTHPQKKQMYLEERWRRKAGGLSVEGTVFSSVEYLKQCLALNRQLAAMDAYRVSEQQIFQQLNNLLALEKINALKDTKDSSLLRSVLEALMPCMRFLSFQPFLKISDLLMQLAGDDLLMKQKISRMIADKKSEHRKSLWKLPIILLLTLILCLLMYFSNTLS